jgi:hypothetical protein
MRGSLIIAEVSVAYICTGACWWSAIYVAQVCRSPSPRYCSQLVTYRASVIPTVGRESICKMLKAFLDDARENETKYDERRDSIWRNALRS